MKDIKELIYAAVEENALKFQELVNNQLQVRAYDAIEALRPEVGASMFGESSHKKMDDDEEDMEDEEDEDEDEDEDEKKSKVEEELKGKQHKIDKNKNGKIDAHDFKLLRKEEAQQIAELSKKTVGSYLKKATNDYADRHGEEGQNQGWDDARGDSAWDDSPNEDDREEHEKEREANIKKMGDRNRGINRAIKKLTKEEVVADKVRTKGSVKFFSKKKLPGSDKSSMNEVAMPKNAADWQALITHQIKTTGHPVATDAQFRAQHGKDMSKPASLEPGEDKLQYATAQGGTVKQ